MMLMHKSQTPYIFNSLSVTAETDVHDHLTQVMRDSFSGMTATLVHGGLSNIHNEPIVASCLQVVKNARLLHTNPLRMPRSRSIVFLLVLSLTTLRTWTR
jgi:hypothetical protein